MGLRRTLISIVSSPLATMLETRLRAIAQEAIEARDYAGPADIRNLSDHVHDAVKAVDDLSAQLKEAQERLAALEAEPLDALADDAIRIAGISATMQDGGDQITIVDVGVREIADNVIQLRDRAELAAKRVDEANARAAEAERIASDAAARLQRLTEQASKPIARKKRTRKARPKPQTNSANRGCKVPDCDRKHRARGFCAKHYMDWKREVLPGFVLADGTAFFADDGPRFQLDSNDAGKPVRLTKGKAIVA